MASFSRGLQINLRKFLTPWNRQPNLKKISYKCKEGVVKFFQKAPQKEDAFRGGFTSESVCFDRLDDSFVQISSAFQFATNPFVISLRQKSALQALHSPQPVVAVLVADEALDILGAGLDRKRMANVQLRAVFIDDLVELGSRPPCVLRDRSDCGLSRSVHLPWDCRRRSGCRACPSAWSGSTDNRCSRRHRWK